MGDDRKIFYTKIKNNNQVSIPKANKKIFKIQKNKKKQPISVIKSTKPEKKKNNADPNSPFAVLEKLL